MYVDGRHKRAWKACERCRTKKIKVGLTLPRFPTHLSFYGEFPCKRCKDNGLTCIAGVRKQKNYKKLPQGYAEVLEHTQFVLIATIHKLYSMATNNQQWDLGEPELNDRGQPVIHNIAQKLGCIRPKSDIDLTAYSVFPKDETGLVELARQPKEQQKDLDVEGVTSKTRVLTEPDSALSCECSGGHSSAKVDHSHFEADHRKAVFGQHNIPTDMSQSFSIGCSEFDVDLIASPVDSAVTMFQNQPSTTNIYVPQLNMARQAAPPQPPTTDLTQHFFQQHDDTFSSMSMLNQSLIENERGNIKPHTLLCPNPEVMGMGDPMWL